MTSITFEGEPPYSMPALQSSEVIAQGENVEMTLYVLVRGKPAPVRVAMLHKVASQLAGQLDQAAMDARTHARKG